MDLHVNISIYFKIIKTKEQLVQTEIPLNRSPVASRILTQVQLVLFLLHSESTISNKRKFASLLGKCGISELSYQTQLSLHSAEE